MARDKINVVWLSKKEREKKRKEKKSLRPLGSEHAADDIQPKTHQRSICMSVTGHAFVLRGSMASISSHPLALVLVKSG